MDGPVFSSPASDPLSDILMSKETRMTKTPYFRKYSIIDMNLFKRKPTNKPPFLKETRLIVNGDLSLVVKLPEYVDLNEWLASHSNTSIT